jgi:xanthine dehydrogenase YagR molybdenum-binding subunit
MANLAWPPYDRRQIVGTRVSRLDGPIKTTGRAKYAYDQNLDGMLYARFLIAPYGHGKIKAIDVSGAEGMDGVEVVQIIKNVDDEFLYAGDALAVVAATSEEIAAEAVKAIKVEYEILEHQVDDTSPDLVSGRARTSEDGDVAAGFDEADVVHEGRYGVATITHCCLEAHGQVCEFKNGELYVWPSTQNVSGYADGLTGPSELDASKIHVDCQVMGGGFGSKFGADQWGNVCTELAKAAGKPVKLMLERDQELMVAGHRPSAYADVRIGVTNDGNVIAWESSAWGSGGTGSAGRLQLPYVFGAVPNMKVSQGTVRTNRGSQRAWRAPGHPQSCLITMSAFEDAAAKAGIDPVTFFKKNLDKLDVRLPDAEKVYAEEIDIAAELIGYKDKWHPRGEGGDGPVKRGLGMSIHTWAGAGHPSHAEVIINPDGSVAVNCATQDLGTGARTCLAIVVAETLGVPLDRVQSNIGNNSLPPDNPSGGSTTIGGISTSSREAATNALNALLAKAAPALGVDADKLEAWEGKIQEIGNPSNNITWQKACALLGSNPVSGSGAKPTADGTELDNSQVGGCQMADVSVDVETGVVTINEIAAVQDIGMIIDLKTAESQVHGALIMGVTYALYEEAIYDPATGKMLNADMEFYRLAGHADVGKFKVHMMQNEYHYKRGVIGLGEPPVISPGAAISNAVANAIGVRVGTLPLTPDKVLAALA